MTVRNCRLSPKINRLEGVIASQGKLIDEGDKTLKQAEKALNKEIKAHAKREAELNGLIDSSNTVIERLTASGLEKARRIRELEDSFPEPPTAEEEIEHWRALTIEWKGRFTLCTETVGEKDKIIFALREKYEALSLLHLQVDGVLDGYRNQVPLLKGQIQTQGVLIAKLERKLRWNKAIKTGSTLAFVAVVVYLFVEK